MTTETVFIAHSGDGVVATYELDGDGRLAETARCEVGPGSTALALDDDRSRMFVSVRTDPEAIATVEIEQDGVLRPARTSEADDSITYLAVDAEGSTLFAVSYGGGFGVALPIGMDGQLGEPTFRVEHANLHSVVVSPDNRHVYMASLGEDLIAQFAFRDATLLPLDPPTVAAPEGSGPRHLVFSRDGRNLYCMTEFSGEAIRLARAEDGTLTREEAVDAYDTTRGLGHSEFGADPVENHYIWGADLHLSPDERFLFCSERCESTLVAVEVDDQGRLGGRASVTDTEKQPRGFAITPGGFLIAVGEQSDQISVYAIEADGSLRQTDRIPGGEKSNWVSVRTH